MMEIKAQVTKLMIHVYSMMEGNLPIEYSRHLHLKFDLLVRHDTS